MTRNTINPYLRDPRLADAAASLASLVKKYRQPLMFDMFRYIENVIGGIGHTPSVALVKILEADPFVPPVRAELIAELATYTRSRIDNAHLKQRFVEALSVKLHRVSESSSVQLGLAEIRDATPVPNKWMFVVIELPRPSECFVLEL